MVLIALRCWANAPTIYSAPANESPVRADPDDLLLLAGYGFQSGDTAVYRKLADTTRPLLPPNDIPSSSTEVLGVAQIVSVADAPYSLTIHLPAVMTTDQSYAIWVVNRGGEWSNAVKINDARPLWITPDEAYSGGPLAALPRVLKLVGRNLQPAPGAATRVRLVGASATFTLPVQKDQDPSAAIVRYVARVELPASMPAGPYRVEVSRDDVSWVSLADPFRQSAQVLNVLPNPAPPARFPVGAYTFGACHPGGTRCPAVRGNCLAEAADDDDQTLCIAAAITAAGAAGGGVVEFAAGTWKMNDPGLWNPGQSFSSKQVSLDGLLVPEGVSLGGAGPAVTTLVRGTEWDIHMPSFALRGHNAVSGLKFRDARTYQSRDEGSAIISLGPRWERANSYEPAGQNTVSHVAIFNNIFDKPFYAIGGGGLAIDHLFVTDNLFGAFKVALFWEGFAANTRFRYRYSDSIVAHNKFFPGSYLDTGVRQGTMATALSGGYRIDFSDNVADGTSTDFFYRPDQDAKGWRAGYFWAMHDNVEMLLVSQNSVTCSGDKDGDGEAIAYDNNHNRPGFLPLAVPVLSATSDPVARSSTITVQGSLLQTQRTYGMSIDVRPVTAHYLGDWLQVVQGPGVGQTRKIADIRTGSNAQGETVTVTVSPAFDVLPQTNSWVTDGRLIWQAYTIGNVIDQRTPCLKSNRTRRAGGLITLDAQTADSVVEGNTQYDTSGISLASQFERLDARAGVEYLSAFVHSFDEIRGNVINGAYDEFDRTPPAEYGIAVLFAATPDTEPPPVMSYGLSISHNVIGDASGPRGAISLNQGWYTGPPSRKLSGVTPWMMADATLIFKNTVTARAGVGVGISADNRNTPIEWRSVLYGNLCRGEPIQAPRLIDRGTETVRVCPSATPDSCECKGGLSELSVTATSAANTVPVGHTAAYTLIVANHGPDTATEVTLSVEPPAGLRIDSIAGDRTECVVEDPNVNLCHLGNIRAGASVSLSVRGKIEALGPSKIIFSVAHQEADVNPANNGVAITTYGLAEQ
jgi:uncharacterized repeat protein (TIGR01451 family)